MRISNYKSASFNVRSIIIFLLAKKYNLIEFFQKCTKWQDIIFTNRWRYSVALITILYHLTKTPFLEIDEYGKITWMLNIYEEKEVYCQTEVDFSLGSAIYLKRNDKGSQRNLQLMMESDQKKIMDISTSFHPQSPPKSKFNNSRYYR